MSNIRPSLDEASQAQTCAYAGGVSMVTFEPLYFGHLYLFRISIFVFRVYASHEQTLCLSAFVAMSQLCKTNPILIRAKINLTLYIKKIYGNFTRLRTMKNEPKTKPICWMLK